MLLIKMFIHGAISAIKSSEFRDELFILKSSLPVRHRLVLLVLTSSGQRVLLKQIITSVS